MSLLSRLPLAPKMVLVASTALLLNACMGTGAPLGYDYQRYQYTTIGTATGALVGGVVGHQVDDDNGRYYGALAGALLGGALGNNMDQVRARDAYNQTPTNQYPPAQTAPSGTYQYGYSQPPAAQPYY